jgi:uncharacterized membrane protein
MQKKPIWLFFYKFNFFYCKKSWKNKIFATKPNKLQKNSEKKHSRLFTERTQIKVKLIKLFRRFDLNNIRKKILEHKSTQNRKTHHGHIPTKSYDGFSVQSKERRRRNFIMNSIYMQMLLILIVACQQLENVQTARKNKLKTTKR